MNKIGLPKEVVELLGDDATPEKAIERFNDERDESSHQAMNESARFAKFAYYDALAGAAISAMEARIAFLSARPGDGNDTASWTRLYLADAAYDALRNWMKP